MMERFYNFDAERTNGQNQHTRAALVFKRAAKTRPTLLRVEGTSDANGAPRRRSPFASSDVSFTYLLAFLNEAACP